MERLIVVIFLLLTACGNDRESLQEVFQIATHNGNTVQLRQIELSRDYYLVAFNENGVETFRSELKEGLYRLDSLSEKNIYISSLQSTQDISKMATNYQLVKSDKY